MRLYCANCGKQLKRIRKALPKAGIIVDLVEYHECSKEPIPFDIDPSTIVEAPPVEGMDKFVKSLNNLDIAKKAAKAIPEGKSLRPSSMTGTDDPRDRRFEQESKIASSAPLNVLDQIKQLGNSIPAHEPKDISTDSEMGD